MCSIATLDCQNWKPSLQHCRRTLQIRKDSAEVFLNQVTAIGIAVAAAAGLTVRLRRQSKLFLPAKLLCVLALAFLLFFPTPKGIRENLLRSATGVQASSASLSSHGDERTINFAETIGKNRYNLGLRLPEPSIMLFLGIGLVRLAVWAKHRGKRTAR